MNSTQQAIDKEALLRRCMGAADFAHSIVNQFLENWDRDYRKLEECVGRAIAERDLRDLTGQAHRMKGTAATIGADVLAQEFQEIEALTDCFDESQLRERLISLQKEIDRISDFAANNF